MKTIESRLYNMLYSNYGIYCFVVNRFKFVPQTIPIQELLLTEAKSRLESAQYWLSKPSNKSIYYRHSDLKKLELFITFFTDNTFSEELTVETANRIENDKTSIRLTERNLSKIDNKKVKVGSLVSTKGNVGWKRGNGNAKNIIRFPSRKHQNRWKNFVKLFPQYQFLYDKYFKQ